MKKIFLYFLSYDVIYRIGMIGFDYCKFNSWDESLIYTCFVSLLANIVLLVGVCRTMSKEKHALFLVWFYFLGLMSTSAIIQDGIDFVSLL